MTNPKHTDTSRSGDLVDDDFAPIWDESILLAEHEAVQASVAVGGWLSAALDDPNVCDVMKADINRWFSAGFLYLDEVRKLMQTDRIEADRAELVAEIVAELRAIAAWNDKSDDGLSGLDKMAEGQRDAADHIEAKFGGRDVK